jgi:ribosomal protein S18 acetylase RimI-like enzyme
MLERLVDRLAVADAPFGVNLRLTDRSLRAYVEPALFAQAFEVTREWIRMEIAALPGEVVNFFPAGFELRAAQAADVERIVQLIYESFEDPTVNPRGWAQAIADEDRQVELLEDSSRRLAGLLHLRRDDAMTGYVSELAVHPKFQRHGLGTALMRWSFGWFREQGLRRAALTTDPGNSRAIALYRKLGFVIAQVGVDYRRSLDEDEVRQVIEKRLGHHITVRRAFT